MKKPKPPIYLIVMICICQFLSSARASDVIEIKEIFEPSGEFSKEKFMKVAVVQWNPEHSARVDFSAEEAEQYKQANREEMEKLIRKAVGEGAQFVVLSEFAVTGYPDIPELPDEDDNFRSRDDIKMLVEPVPGKSSDYFSNIAKELKIHLQYGLAEVDLTTDYYHNTAVVLNPEGKIVAKYRKRHLFGLESNFLVPGEKNVTFNSPIGKIGLIICSDSYSDKVISNYRERKVDILSLSTSWAQANTGMEQFRYTAIWANAYVLAANQNYFPDSGIINPDGSLQSHIRQSRSAIAYGYLPLKDSTQVNKKKTLRKTKKPTKR